MQVVGAVVALSEVNLSVVNDRNAYQTIAEIFLKCQMNAHHIDNQTKNVDDDWDTVFQEEKAIFGNRWSI